MIKKPFLGVCYYPEHWSDTHWVEDATKMKALGLSQVRIGEFAWSRIEPNPGDFSWGWLDRAIDTLGNAGLEVMLGTPTATPPKWLIDQNPDILAVDRHGRPRQFGSRRHYCFSSDTYRRECARIVEKIAVRYGGHPAVTAWQTDNEYGCHDTIRSYSPAAQSEFRQWLQERYGDIGTLNAAWGTVFWSQEYRDFSDIELPNLTVTEPNPSHVLDFYRFSSDQVVRFNRLQTEILRQHAPKSAIAHNFMGFFFDFDHFAVAEDLDLVGWDSYPIGFLDVGGFPTTDKKRYMRQGHPDIAAFHHDLYRSVGANRWCVLEQQPGPVNWAPHNPAPLQGMVRLWTLEAIAHGAENVNYFRWRQAPFAQEQMHAGLERPDHAPAMAHAEVKKATSDLSQLDGLDQTTQADVAIVFSYETFWLFEAQPQGANWRYPEIVFSWYTALRRFGLNVDFIHPKMDIDAYKLVIVPSMPIIDRGFLQRVEQTNSIVLFGARSGSKTQTLTIPDSLAPGDLQHLIPIKITHAESLPDFVQLPAAYRGTEINGTKWLDHIETSLDPEISSGANGLLYRHNNVLYLTTQPDAAFLASLISAITQDMGIETHLLPPDLRMRKNGDLCFLFNYGPEKASLPSGLDIAPQSIVVGKETLQPGGVTVWKK